MPYKASLLPASSVGTSMSPISILSKGLLVSWPLFFSYSSVLVSCFDSSTEVSVGLSLFSSFFFKRAFMNSEVSIVTC